MGEILDDLRQKLLQHYPNERDREALVADGDMERFCERWKHAWMQREGFTEDAWDSAVHELREENDLVPALMPGKGEGNASMCGDGIHIEPPPLKTLALLKVGSEAAHMHDLRNGKLYCRSLSYYSRVEGKPLAHQDALDGLDSIFQAGQISIHLKLSGRDPIVLNADNGLIGEVLVARHYDCPVFCLHAIHTGMWRKSFSEDQLSAFHEALQVPPSMNKFGEHVWLITNASAFFARVRRACIAQGIGVRGRHVQYVDPCGVHGVVPRELRGFAKLDSFKEERELRLLFDSANELPDPFILDVGSLQDISLVTTLAEFRLGCKFEMGEISDK